ncbi:isochorismatase family protein (plasmid) [Acaryochloris sp. 'Moss Beach']|uniref:isochorismatase family protein n=1 Tax=Acaryochloris sp. 'Moss Beach' TaxID=2740837 RepID=UPI001F44CD7B|nr:isochorismatase family protein [Acaryochloris sp. 'Moss Beach']UJB72231.1 isochorismatase family protein [Acaryochloris sp. 'Moss Beach']
MTIPRISPYPMPTAEVFPLNRVEWSVQPSRAVLLIHDMQNYFLNFFDVNTTPIPALLQNITDVRDCCRERGIPVFYTAQPAEQSTSERGLLTDFWGPGLGSHPEQEVIPELLKPAENEEVLTKWRYSAFQRTKLQSLLKQLGRNQLIVCGVYGHIGCLMTACDAFMNDIQPFLIGDAIADFSLNNHHMAMNYVAQRCGMTVSSQNLKEMLESSPNSVLLEKERLSLNLSQVAVTQALRQQLSELLQHSPQSFGVEEDLLDWGLDSLRLMSLVETWRSRGANVSFADLAERPTISAWTQMLSSSQASNPVNSSRI